jgi:hypothetical protein
MQKSADKGASGTHARRALCDPTVLVVASVLLGVGLGLLFSHLGWDAEESSKCSASRGSCG